LKFAVWCLFSHTGPSADRSDERLAAGFARVSVPLLWLVHKDFNRLPGLFRLISSDVVHVDLTAICPDIGRDDVYVLVTGIFGRVPRFQADGQCRQDRGL